ncbi:MAG: AAA family ATPase [Treponema sp.]|nr:AAA family ATPase [Treponema sp.]
MTNSAHIKFVLFLTVLFTALTVTAPLYYFDIYFFEREPQALIAHLSSLGIKNIALIAGQILASGLLGELFSRLVLKDKPGIAFASRALRVFFWTVPGLWLWIGKDMLAPLSGTFVALWLSFAFVTPGVGDHRVVTLEAHPFFFCILSLIIPQALEHFFFWSEVWYFIFPFAFALVSKFLSNLLSRRIIDESNEVPIVIVLGLVAAAVTAMIDTSMLAALYEWSTAKYVFAYIGIVLVYAFLAIMLIGMSDIKTVVRDLIATIRTGQEREKLGLKGAELPVHIVLTGNPGTGKTTVSRILAKIFKAIGMLPTDKLVETDRSALVAEYVGQTAPLVQKKCDEAMGGVLFIDEAYTLANGGERDFGKEAIDTLLKRMEDDRGKFVVIVAGYKNEMHRFIESNPGLKSRFTTFIDIEDYNVDELCALADCFAEADDKVFAPDAKTCVREKIERIVANKGADFANGRTVREEVFNKAVTRMDSRHAALPVEELTADALRTILPEDIA